MNEKQIFYKVLEENITLTKQLKRQFKVMEYIKFLMIFLAVISSIILIKFMFL